MAENVMLKTDSVLSSQKNSASTRSQTGLLGKATPSETPFSAEFNKHIEANTKATTKHDNKTSVSHDSTDTKKVTSSDSADTQSQKTEAKQTEDGKNLPQSQKTTHQTGGKSVKDTANAKVDKTDNASDKVTDKSKSDTKQQTDAGTTASEVAQTVVQKHSIDNTDTKHPNKAEDKKIKSAESTDSTSKTVTVDAHAASHSKARKVDMKGGEHGQQLPTIKQTDKNKTDQSATKKTHTEVRAERTHPQLGSGAVTASDLSDTTKSDKKEQSQQSTDKIAATAVDVTSTKTASDDAKSSINVSSKQTAVSQNVGKSIQHSQLQPTQAAVTQPQPTQQHTTDHNTAQQSAANASDGVKVVLQQHGNTSNNSNSSAGLRPDIMHAISKHSNHTAPDTNSAMKTVQTLIADAAKSQQPVHGKSAPAVTATPNTTTDNLTAGLLNTSSGNGQLLSVNAGSTSLAGIQSTQNASTSTMLDVQPNMQSAAWARVMSSRVVWMAKEGIQRAHIKLNPANLGPVEVRLHMHNDQASVSFVVHHAATRDALEQALPKLRDSFVDNGLALANAEVSQQQHPGGQSDPGAGQHETMNDQIIIQANDNEDDTINDLESNKANSASSTVGLSLYA